MTYQLLDSIESGKKTGVMILIKQKGRKPAILTELKDSFGASYQVVKIYETEKLARI